MSYTCEIEGVHYKAVAVKGNHCHGCAGEFDKPLCEALLDCPGIIWLLDETQPESELDALRQQLATYEQRVAEACAKYVTAGLHDDDPYIIAQGIIDGAWREKL